MGSACSRSNGNHALGRGMNRKPNIHVAEVICFVALATHLNAASAIGFGLAEESVVNLGYALAGSAANAEDASTLYFNPAGMAKLKSGEFDVGVHAISVTARFKDSGSVGPAGAFFPLSGGAGGNPGGLSWVPNLYVVTPVDSQTSIGLGITAPFGLSTDYDPGWLGRYQATRSQIKSVLFNPAISYKWVDGVALGVGFNAEYFKADLANAIDFGAACFGSPFGPANCAMAGITPGAKDGFVSVSGDSWAYGFNAGALFDLGSNSRIGVAYRSRITHELRGNAKFSNPDLPPPFDALTASTQNTGARATITVPDALSISGYFDLGSGLSLLTDVTWSRWSVLREIRIRFDNGLADSVIPANWRNTTRVALGIGYDVNEKLRLRAGAYYERSTIPDAYRTARIPDGNQTMAAIGLSYVLSHELTVDLAYAHIFEPRPSVNNSIAGAGSLVGSFDAAGDILSAQLRYRF
jgi:long-chain fatty acid transport protein